MDPLVRAVTQHLEFRGRVRILDAAAGDGDRLLSLADYLANLPEYRGRGAQAVLDSLYAATDRVDSLAGRLGGWAAARGEEAPDVHAAGGDPLALKDEPAQGDLFRLSVSRKPPATFDAAPFDAVVADVPRVELNAEEREALRDRYESARGRFTFEGPFVERVVGLVAPGGLVALRLRLAVLRREFGRALVETILGATHLIAFEVDSDHAILVMTRASQIESRSVALLRALGSSEAAAILERLQRPAAVRLGGMADGAIGVTSTPGCDEVWEAPPHLSSVLPTMPLLRGEDIGSWRPNRVREVLWPYDASGQRVDVPSRPLVEWLSRFRVHLEGRRYFGKTIQERGIRWYEYLDHHPERWAGSPTIVMNRSGTHVRAALIRDPVVVSGTALALTPRDEDVAALVLGVLGSSVGTFWCKHAFHVYDRVDGRAFEATVQGLGQLPLPGRGLRTVMEAARRCDAAARAIVDPSSAIAGEPARLRERLAAVQTANEAAAERLRFWQEELDWAVYWAYELVQSYQKREWSSEPSTEAGDAPDTDGILGARWGELASNEAIRTLETSEYKRPAETEPWEEVERHALTQWVAAKISDAFASGALPRDRPVSDEEVEGLLQTDPLAREVLTVAATSVAEVMLRESVPLEPARLYTSRGTRKLDQIARGVAATFGPEDYAACATHHPPCSAGAHRRRLWSIRGRYGVPAERFIHLADLSEVSQQALFGWAGASKDERRNVADRAAAETGTDQLDLERILNLKGELSARPGVTTAELAKRLWPAGWTYRDIRLVLGVLEGSGAIRAAGDRWFTASGGAGLRE